MQRKSDQLDKLGAALAKAQGDIEGARKDSSNPFFRSKYANLESVVEACRPTLVANGLSVVQTLGEGALGPTLVTTLLHSSGQWIEGEQPLCALSKKPGEPVGAQDLGSAITYARRYGMAAIVGVIQVDDDGEFAMGRGGQDRGGIPMGKTPGNGGSQSAAVANRTGAATEALKGRIASEQKGIPAAGVAQNRGEGHRPAPRGGNPEPQGQGIDEFFRNAGEPAHAANDAQVGDSGPKAVRAVHGRYDEIHHGGVRDVRLNPGPQGQKEAEVRGSQVHGTTAAHPGDPKAGSPVQPLGATSREGASPQGRGPGQGSVVPGADSHGPAGKGGPGRQIHDARAAAQPIPPKGERPIGQASERRTDVHETQPAGSRVGEAGSNVGAGTTVRPGGPERLPPGAGEAGQGEDDVKFALFTSIGEKLKAAKTLPGLKKEWILAQGSLYKLSEAHRQALETLKEQKKAVL